MRKTILLFAFFLAPLCAFAQQGNQSLPGGISNGTGAPSGACAPGSLYTNNSNGNLYSCNAGTWGLAGAAGTVTHTAGNLTALHLMLGNGIADSTVDSACVTNGTGALSGCTSISAGSGASSAGATATGGYACVEGASTGWTPTIGQVYKRCDNTLHNFVTSISGSAETPDPVFAVAPAGSKCLQTAGSGGLIAETAGACASAPSYPVTVSGTVTSGGIPYFSSTTVESSSALLATNALVVGGGAGTAPKTGNGDFTYATNTLTGGASAQLDLHSMAVDSFRIPVVTSDIGGSTEGAIEMFHNGGNPIIQINTGGGRGALAMAALSTNVRTTCTNQVLIQISSYEVPTCSSLSAFVTSDYTNATTTLSNVTGLAVTLAANTNYAVSCKLIYQGSATTASMVLSSTGPASPTKISAQNTQTTTSGAGAAMYSDASDGTSFAFTLGPAAVVSTAVDLPSTLDIGIMNGANAGTFQLQAKANGVGTITIKKGSFCKWQ